MGYKAAPYFKYDLEVFRELAEKPYGKTDAFVDYANDLNSKTDQQIQDNTSYGRYAIKWGWSKDKVRYWLPRFSDMIKESIRVAEPAPVEAKEPKNDIAPVNNYEGNMPDGYIFENPKDFIGVARNHDGTFYENIIIDHVYKKNGKLERYITFSDGGGVGHVLNKEDALKIYAAYRAIMARQSVDPELEKTVAELEEGWSKGAGGINKVLTTLGSAKRV